MIILSKLNLYSFALDLLLARPALDLGIAGYIFETLNEKGIVHEPHNITPYISYLLNLTEQVFEVSNLDLYLQNIAQVKHLSNLVTVSKLIHLFSLGIEVNP